MTAVALQGTFNFPVNGTRSTRYPHGKTVIQTPPSTTHRNQFHCGSIYTQRNFFSFVATHFLLSQFIQVVLKHFC